VNDRSTAECTCDGAGGDDCPRHPPLKIITRTVAWKEGEKTFWGFTIEEGLLDDPALD